MNAALFLVLSGCMLAICTAHLCLLNPRQRGSLSGFNKPGADDCYLTKGECGGRLMEPNHRVIFTRGMNYTVVLQKNLDHHNDTDPGSFEISLKHRTSVSYYERQLASIPDTAAPSLSLYTAEVYIPADLQLSESPEYVIEVVYMTNTIPLTFIQCADIIVV